jgi:hypothetical protein
MKLPIGRSLRRSWRNEGRSERRQSRRFDIERLEERLMLKFGPLFMLNPAPGAEGGNAPQLATSPAGVQYATGYTALGGSFLAQDNFGAMFGASLFWTNQPNAASGIFGSGMASAELPQLRQLTVGSATVMAVFNGPIVDSFAASGGSYLPLNGSVDTLTSTGSGYSLTDSSGANFVFNSGGALDSMTDAGGNSAVVTPNADGTVHYVLVSSTSSSVTDKFGSRG